MTKIFLAVACTVTLFTVSSSYAFQSAPNQSILSQMKTRNSLLKDSIVESDAKIKSIKEAKNENQNFLDELNVSDTSHPDVMRLLQTRRVQLMIDLAGINARRDLSTKIQQFNDDADAKASKNSDAETIVLLESLVENQKEAVKGLELMFKNGVVPPSDVQEGRTALIEAQLKLAEAKKGMKKSGGSSMPIPGGTDLHTKIALEHAEVTARLHMVEKLLKQYVQSRPHVERISLLQQEYESEIQRQADLKDRLRKSNEEIQLLKLEVGDH